MLLSPPHLLLYLVEAGLIDKHVCWRVQSCKSDSNNAIKEHNKGVKRWYVFSCSMVLAYKHSKELPDSLTPSVFKHLSMWSKNSGCQPLRLSRTGIVLCIFRSYFQGLFFFLFSKNSVQSYRITCQLCARRMTLKLLYSQFSQIKA